ncbi:MAG: hypothetical protein C00003105_00536 [ANME-2 cluster archaeon HR1]|nr:MAG: hypothetical protein C00003105_00536 [ANME-2 cluster archaeon HR1]
MTFIVSIKINAYQSIGWFLSGVCMILTYTYQIIPDVINNDISKTMIQCGSEWVGVRSRDLTIETLIIEI